MILVKENKNGKTQPVHRGVRIRRLTPVEAERLQGFPDGWTEGISDTQRYKCLGNAVTTNVISAIGTKIAGIYSAQNKEESMTMESELKRIADALERIETKIGAPLKIEEPKPVAKRKSTKAIPVAPEPVATMTTADELPDMTTDQLKRYCNGALSAITDPAARKSATEAAVAMIKEQFRVTTIGEIPVERVLEAKAAFDALMGGAEEDLI